MTQDERWLARYNEVLNFIQVNRRNPSRYDAEERGLYLNWLKHNRKLYHNGGLKPERIVLLKQLLELSEKFRRKNQYVCHPQP